MSRPLIYALVRNCYNVSTNLWHNKENFNSRKLLKEEYQCSYTELKTTTVEKDNKIIINIEREYDMIDNIDLVTSDTDNIKSIELVIGGRKIDIFDSGDLKTQINTLCELFGNNRRVTKNFMPLELLLFHSNNIYAPLLLQYQDTKIIVSFHNEVIDCKLNGNIYNLNERHNLVKMEKVLNYGIQSYNYPNMIIKNGINKYKLDSCFNPSSLLYFWGFDKLKVKNIKLKLDNGCYYYNGSIESLEYRKHSLGYTHCEPVVIFFTTEKLTEYSRGNLNLYMMENSELIIETDQEETSDFYLVNIGARALECTQGKIGYLYDS